MQLPRKSLFVLGFIILQSYGVHAQSTDHVIHNMINEVSIYNLTGHLRTLEEAGGTRNRIAFTPGVDSAAAYIKEQFDAMPGLTSVKYDTFYISTVLSPFDAQPQVNVVATIEGKKYPDQSYVIGAHIDATADRDNGWGYRGTNWQTIEAPGADDNATGVAGILEIGRIMADPDIGFSPDYTITLVAFGAEERLPEAIYSGLGAPSNHHGSTHFADRAAEEGENILGMISLDMIGYNNSNHYTSIVYHSTVRGLDRQAIAIGERYLEVNSNYSIGLTTNASPFAQGSYSDHRSFAVAGFPSVLMIENAAPWNSNYYYSANPYYHRSSDTFDKVNMDLVKKVTQLNLATLASFGGTVTSTDDVPEPPRHRHLAQNYPNPFYPRTSIQFDLALSGHVNLSVYDILGNKVRELLSGVRSAGRHTVNFDLNDLSRELSSGVYIYRLVTDHFVESRQMILVK